MTNIIQFAIIGRTGWFVFSRHEPKKKDDTQHAKGKGVIILGTIGKKEAKNKAGRYP